MKRLKDKVAIVTGGGQGIGEADSILFAREGARVVIADIDKKASQRVVEAIKAQGNEAIFFDHDVTSESSWKELFSFVKSKYGKVNILINNAGVSLGKDIEDTSLEEWLWVMDINATGVFLGTKYAIEHMKGLDENCSIVNRSSIDGQVGEADLAAYCASKGAVTLLTKAAALSCGENGYKIRVNSVHPGYVRTSMTEKEAVDSGLGQEAYFKKVGKMHPIGYIGNTMDIAYADLYLASDESLFVTGSELTVDGGWTAQ